MPIEVPAETDSEPHRWGAVVQGCALLIVKSMPELYLAITPPSPAWLPRLQGRQVYVDYDAHLRTWGAQLAADALTAFILGPLAMESLLLERALMGRGPGSDEITVGEDARLVSPMPPLILRGALTLAVLEEYGFRELCPSLEARWLDDTESVSSLGSPSLFEQQVRLPLAPYVLLGKRLLIDEICPDLLALFDDSKRTPMSTEHWSSLRLKALALLARKSIVTESALDSVAVAMLAAVEMPGNAQRISSWLLETLMPEATPTIESHRVDIVEPVTDLRLVRKAFILRELLRRPHRPPGAAFGMGKGRIPRRPVERLSLESKTDG